MALCKGLVIAYICLCTTLFKPCQRYSNACTLPYLVPSLAFAIISSRKPDSQVHSSADRVSNPILPDAHQILWDNGARGRIKDGGLKKFRFDEGQEGKQTS